LHGNGVLIDLICICIITAGQQGGGTLTKMKKGAFVHEVEAPSVDLFVAGLVDEDLLDTITVYRSHGSHG
jgi:hypothetical protein